MPKETTDGTNKKHFQFTGRNLYIRYTSREIRFRFPLPRICLAILVMFRNVLGRVLTVNDRIRRCGIKLQFAERTPIVFPSLRNFSDRKDDVSQTFDTSLLQFLVCPLSKKPLRWHWHGGWNQMGRLLQYTTEFNMRLMVNVGYALFCHMPTVIIYHDDFREE